MKLSIVTISTFVAMLNQATKYIATNLFGKDVTKFIPILSVVYGIILGLIGFFMSDVEMGSDVIEAIMIGISAGSASTGLHQIGKQISKNNDDTETQTDDAPETIDQTSDIDNDNLKDG